MSYLLECMKQGHLRVFEMPLSSSQSQEPLALPWAAVPEPRVFSECPHLLLLQTDALDDARYAQVLSQDEKARLEQLKFSKERRARAKSRGFLREVLGLYTGVSPSELQFRYGPEGKPSLVQEQQGEYAFNTSHSGNMVAVLVGKEAAIGLDVEQNLLPFPQVLSIAKRFFHSSEQEALSRLGKEAASRLFQQIWTYKEAWLKNQGLGITSIFKTPAWETLELEDFASQFSKLTVVGQQGFQWRQDGLFISAVSTSY